MKNGTFLTLSGILAITSACSQVALPNSKTQITVDPIESKLISAANAIEQSLTQLAEIESVNTPKSMLPKPESAELLGMTSRASIDWTGPIEPLIQKIAQSAHYEVHILGHEPAIPTIISVRAKNTNLANILRNAQFQAQKSAEIVVYPSTKVIEIRYLAG